MKKRLWILGFGAILFIALGLVVPRTIAQTAPTAVINTGALNIRSGPGVGYGSTAVVNNGARVTLLGRNSNSSWAKVRLANGHEGWVNVTLIIPTTPISNLPLLDVPTLSATAVIATGALNIRTGPGIAFPVVTVAQQGNVVALLARSSNGWVNVRLADGRQGWVNANHVTANVAISSLPLINSPSLPATAVASVNTDVANVRSAPTTNSTVIATSQRSHIVQLLGRTADVTWVKVRLFSGQEGWMSAGLLLPNVPLSSLPALTTTAPAPANPVASVATGALNVRSGPGIGFGVVTISQNGHVVALLGRNSNGSWVKVRVFDGREGWVNANYITPNVPISSLPVVG